jgi:AraC-like DNA-binding protein
MAHRERVADQQRVADQERVRAWRPPVPGVREVFHARFTRHAYPMHTHDCWTLLIVDDGAVRYGLDRREHGTLRSLVTLLPPNVPHDGRAATPAGFTKRVLYLDGSVLDDALAGRAVDAPTLRDPLLRRRVGQLHRALALPDPWEASSRLALLRERLQGHLTGGELAAPEPHDPGTAARLRELIDGCLPDGITLPQAATRLQVSPGYLIRTFTRAYGLPPHLYLTGRRVELARRLLLAGEPPAQVATQAGFYDQAHLTRHFRRMVGTTPGRYASGRPAASGSGELPAQR